MDESREVELQEAIDLIFAYLKDHAENIVRLNLMAREAVEAQELIRDALEMLRVWMGRVEERL